MFREWMTRIVAVLVLAGPGVCTAAPTEDAGAQTALAAFVSYADLRLGSIRQTLELLAATSDVQSGRWETMKGPLAAWQAADPGLVAWFALPDGRYFTGDKGPMDASLRDRDYFPDLLAGREVIGALVVSRSTGQRSAVIAVPLVRGTRVIGAIGVSLFLDHLAQQVDSALALPADMSFFALAPNALTTLHRRLDRHFLDPRELGSQSLRSAADEMLAKPSGVVTYEFDNRTKRGLHLRSGLTGWTFAVTWEAGPVE